MSNLQVNKLRPVAGVAVVAKVVATDAAAASAQVQSYLQRLQSRLKIAPVIVVKHWLS